MILRALIAGLAVLGVLAGLLVVGIATLAGAVDGDAGDWLLGALAGAIILPLAGHTLIRRLGAAALLLRAARLVARRSARRRGR